MYNGFFEVNGSHRCSSILSANRREVIAAFSLGTEFYTDKKTYLVRTNFRSLDWYRNSRTVL